MTKTVFQSPRFLGSAAASGWAIGALAAVVAAVRAEPAWLTAAGYLHFGAAVATIVWTHRMYSNLSALGFTDLRFSPVWAAAAYIVPIANLFVPYQVLTEVRTKLLDPEKAMHFPLVVWWLAYLVAYGASFSGTFASTLTRGGAMALVAGVGAGLFGAISQRQEELAKIAAAR